MKTPPPVAQILRFFGVVGVILLRFVCVCVCVCFWLAFLLTFVTSTYLVQAG